MGKLSKGSIGVRGDCTDPSRRFFRPRPMPHAVPNNTSNRTPMQVRMPQRRVDARMSRAAPQPMAPREHGAAVVKRQDMVSRAPSRPSHHSSMDVASRPSGPTTGPLPHTVAQSRSKLLEPNAPKQRPQRATPKPINCISGLQTQAMGQLFDIPQRHQEHHVTAGAHPVPVAQRQKGRSGAQLMHQEEMMPSATVASGSVSMQRQRPPPHQGMAHQGMGMGSGHVMERGAMAATASTQYQYTMTASTAMHDGEVREGSGVIAPRDRTYGAHHAIEGGMQGEASANQQAQIGSIKMGRQHGVAPGNTDSSTPSITHRIMQSGLTKPQQHGRMGGYQAEINDSMQTMTGSIGGHAHSAHDRHGIADHVNVQQAQEVGSQRIGLFHNTGRPVEGRVIATAQGTEESSGRAHTIGAGTRQPVGSRLFDFSAEDAFAMPTEQKRTLGDKNIAIPHSMATAAGVAAGHTEEATMVAAAPSRYAPMGAQRVPMTGSDPVGAEEVTPVRRAAPPMQEGARGVAHVPVGEAKPASFLQQESRVQPSRVAMGQNVAKRAHKVLGGHTETQPEALDVMDSSRIEALAQAQRGVKRPRVQAQHEREPTTTPSQAPAPIKQKPIPRVISL